MDQSFFIYVLSRDRGLYVDLTTNLYRRIYRHRTQVVSFNSAGLRLVYFECHSVLSDAIFRKNEIKHWGQKKLIRMIGASNPDWLDLDVLDLDVLDSVRRKEGVNSGW